MRRELLLLLPLQIVMLLLLLLLLDVGVVAGIGQVAADARWEGGHGARAAGRNKAWNRENVMVIAACICSLFKKRCVDMKLRRQC